MTSTQNLMAVFTRLFLSALPVFITILFSASINQSGPHPCLLRPWSLTFQQRGGLLKPAGDGQLLRKSVILFNLDRLNELRDLCIFSDHRGQNLCMGL